jgi:SSS family solute:Na+ symporter
MALNLTAASATLPAADRLVSLAPADVLVIVIYFAMVLGIGVYLKRYANTSNQFFMAGREMSAWVAGLSFRKSGRA